jgi:hypothetical protein
MVAYRDGEGRLPVRPRTGGGGRVREMGRSGHQARLAARSDHVPSAGPGSRRMVGRFCNTHLAKVSDDQLAKAEQRIA